MSCRILGPERVCRVCGRTWRDAIGGRRACSRTCDETKRANLYAAINAAKRRRAS